MRLCDFLLFDPDDDGTDGRPLNRCPAGPWREGTDPPKCWRCGGWVPHGPLLDPICLKVLAGEASSLLAKLVDDWPYVHDLAHNPTSRPQNGRSGSRPDPTGNSASDRRRAVTAAYATVACRLVERVVVTLRHADDAAGSALYSAEPPGPKDHVKAAYHDGRGPLVGRPDIEDAHAARDRRRARGEL